MRGYGWWFGMEMGRDGWLSNMGFLAWKNGDFNPHYIFTPILPYHPTTQKWAYQKDDFIISLTLD